jgi:cold shock CspA family protein
MAISYNKKELEKKKQTKKLEKQKRKDERKAQGGSSLDDMIAYVDENGMISNTPPDPDKKQKVNLVDISVSTPKKEEVEETPLKGRVEHFNQDKGYGFIKDMLSTDKYFFHVSNAPANLTEGSVVFFETERGPKGMNAVNISLENK